MRNMNALSDISAYLINSIPRNEEKESCNRLDS